MTGRAARAIARAPIAIYKAGFGFLFGQRVLLVEHTGRKSGLPRYVVLEVLRRLPGDRYVVPSGRGTAADWYRNITQEHRVHVSVGRLRCVAATARRLDQDEARPLLQEYSAQRPGLSRLLGPLISRLMGRSGQSNDALFETVPLVELTLDRSE